MSIEHNRRHIVAISPSYSSAMQLRSVRSRYDQRASDVTVLFRHRRPWRFKSTLPLRSWRSGQLQAWFKCSPKVGVALLDSRTNSVEDLVKHERFHSHVIKLEK